MQKRMKIKLSEVKGVATAMAKTLRGGEILALIGPLGSGKTTFTQTLGKALGIKRRIASPTFILMQKFSARRRLTFYHLDLYRTRSFREIQALGITEWWGKPSTITVIEWAGKIRRHLPPRTRYIYLSHDRTTPMTKPTTQKPRRRSLAVAAVIITAAILSFGKFHYAAAQVKSDIIVENETSHFTLDHSLAESWRATVVLPARSVIERPLLDLNDLRAKFAGFAKPKQQPTDNVTYQYDPAQAYNWVAALAPNLSTVPLEPHMEIVNGRAVNFQPPIPGQFLDAHQTTLNLLGALEQGKATAELAVRATAPRTKLSATNNLGINELIGHGESDFKGSPNNRMHNIRVGVANLNGRIIPPGEEFSFDENICPVDKSGGYLPELVILASGTVPEYGGGLCQVSSTLFRAVMHSGVAITQRKNHSYAVQYYAPQGSDATTYCGGIDFKFRNDTPASILVYPYIVPGTTKLVFDFYGTKDGREVIVDKPTQYDRKSDGSMKATWTRTVTNNGESRQDVFKSVYLPPALFHKPPPVDPNAPVVAPGTPVTPPITAPQTPPPTPPATSTVSLNH